MARSISHLATPSVPANWSGGIRALLAAAVMASLWLSYGTTPALFAAVGVALYAAIGPLQLGTLIFSRRTATLSLQWGVYFVAAIIFINVVGHATQSRDVVLSSLANLAFICGLAVVGVVVLRAIWCAFIRAAPQATGLWSSAMAILQSQITLLHLSSRPTENFGNETQVQESLSPDFDPQ
jgi:hypothetical protein